MQTVTEYARQRVTGKVAEWRKLARGYRANIDKYPAQAEYWRNVADFARDIASYRYYISNGWDVSTRPLA